MRFYSDCIVYRGPIYGMYVHYGHAVYTEVLCTAQHCAYIVAISMLYIGPQYTMQPLYGIPHVCTLASYSNCIIYYVRFSVLHV